MEFNEIVRQPHLVLPAADLYYLHTPYLYLPVRRRCRELGVPFVYDAHDLYSDLKNDGRPLSTRDRMQLFVWDWIERWCVRRASACVTVGEGVGDLHDRRFRREFAVVRNAQDPRLDEPAIPVRERLELPSDSFVMVTVGNAKPRGMALGNAIESMKLLPENVHWVFLGGNYDDFAEEIAKTGLDLRVHVVPPVLPHHVTATITGCQLSPIPYFPVMANMRFAMPNGFFHAVAAGVPVAAPTGLDELRATVERYGIGITFDPLDSLSLVTGVRTLMSDASSLLRMTTAVSRAMPELAWPREEEKLRAVVANCL